MNDIIDITLLTGVLGCFLFIITRVATVLCKPVLQATTPKVKL